ncbi:MAG: 2-hydroxychromene-2-carboxylate isomerase [Parasphingorhabdus sp.]
MTLQADVYWSFRSPYSYLATRRYIELTEKYDLQINQRFVYPLAIREPEFFEKNHPNWLGYTFKDIFRVAQFMDIPMAPPNPDPIVQDIATRKISAEQPYIFELTRMGQVASRRGKGLEFADEVSQLIWGGIANWHEGNHLTEAAERAGLDIEQLRVEANAQPAELDAEIADNQKALETAGHWGVPTLVFEDEPFFGQDRIEIAVWRLKQNGLTER